MAYEKAVIPFGIQVLRSIFGIEVFGSILGLYSDQPIHRSLDSGSELQQHSTFRMSPVIPFDILSLIIDIV